MKRCAHKGEPLFQKAGVCHGRPERILNDDAAASECLKGFVTDDFLAAPDPGNNRSSKEFPTMADLPIACALTPDALRARREGLLSDLVRRAEGREDVSEGLRLRFAPTSETLATIARAVEAERHCCRFLRFGITVEPDGGPVFLELTGPSGTRDFISALLEL
jgi:hypothetical protein